MRSDSNPWPVPCSPRVAPTPPPPPLSVSTRVHPFAFPREQMKGIINCYYVRSWSWQLNYSFCPPPPPPLISFRPQSPRPFRHQPVTHGGPMQWQWHDNKKVPRGGSASGSNVGRFSSDSTIQDNRALSSPERNSMELRPTPGLSVVHPFVRGCRRTSGAGNTILVQKFIINNSAGRAGDS